MGWVISTYDVEVAHHGLKTRSEVGLAIVSIDLNILDSEANSCMLLCGTWIGCDVCGSFVGSMGLLINRWVGILIQAYQM